MLTFPLYIYIYPTILYVIQSYSPIWSSLAAGFAPSPPKDRTDGGEGVAGERRPPKK